MPNVIRFNDQHWPAATADLAHVLDHLPEPLAYFDAARRLSVCNRGFREAFPVLIESDFVRRLEENTLLSLRGAAANSGPELVPRARATPEGGTLITFHDDAPLKALEDKHRRVVDKLTAKLVAARAGRRRALAAAQARKDLLASTSHELRTPLNAILGFSEIMTGELFGPLGHDRYSEYARIIHESGGRLLGLINDLLDLSRLDAGKLELHYDHVEILRVIVDCVRQVEVQATRSRVGIAVHVYDGVTGLLGDDKRLHQMLLNLLSNALKFTPERGEINVDVFRRADFIGISVSDTGIGIAQEDIPKVLAPYGQVDSAQARRHVGSGLGLPLTKELAELHGGSLTLESAVDAGTTITLLLPEQPQGGHAAA